MQTHQVLRERLRQEIKRKNISAVELARRAGVKNSFIYDVLNGKSMNPSTVRLAQVANALGISLAYLAGSSDSPDMLSGAGDGETVSVPYLSVLSQEGRAHAAAEEKPVENYTFHRNWIRSQLRVPPESLRMLRIQGDSMTPTLQERDVVLLDTSSKSPSPPGIFIVSDGFGLLAKRLEFVTGAADGTTPKVRIISDNPRYGEYQRDVSEIRILGRVVWFSREI